MSIFYKSAKDIEAMRKSAEILSKAHGEVAKHVRSGVKTKYLDKIAQEYIKDSKGTPSFLNYNGFPASLCISVNDQVVHGFPSDYELRSGDVISIDCGVYFEGFHADCAYTYPIGEVSKEVLKLLKSTKESLYVGIESMKVGSRVGDIGYAIQQYVEKNGYSIIRELTGHGVGRNLHEKPEVPNFGQRGKGPLIRNGLVIAVEPMVNMGRRDIVQLQDGWTIRTKDRKPSAHYEHTVAFIDNKVEILTSFKYIEEVFNF